MIYSPDGHCRAFDHMAKGMVEGDGLGIVVLKRLDDALQEEDYIYAVIKGSAINNDGSSKVGYTAPSVAGQAEVIATSLAIANIPAETIGYVEAHGTGTSLGDPIEIEALTQAFRLYTSKKGFCAVGSVKTNIGHLIHAAGIAGLIKAVLSIQHGVIPSTLHFEKPNPQIDFDNSPFYVNNYLQEWSNSLKPHRAGVSSFGIGGTNAHVILEEAPIAEASSPSRPWHLLVLSAKTSSALDTATTNLAEHL
jgi:acyl transferase domain-containing protein